METRKRRCENVREEKKRISSFLTNLWVVILVSMLGLARAYSIPVLFKKERLINDYFYNHYYNNYNGGGAV